MPRTIPPIPDAVLMEEHNLEDDNINDSIANPSQSHASEEETTTTRKPDYEVEITDNLGDLLEVLPTDVAATLKTLDAGSDRGGLIEIILDLGRRPEARFEEGEMDLVDRDISREDLHYVASRIGSFGDDNRAGIERTLHRISAIRNRSGSIVGLTCRIGRAVYGTIAIISDLVESGESILLLGRPGVGKTTMLRESARVLADDLTKRVVIVDTSNEIAGDGDIPHPAIGRARRMQVPTPTAQHAVMIEAVENHMPEVIVIDEIGTELEAMAARTIAERGVQLIGTAHGNTLENLMMNPTLADLIGGIQSVTLSDEEARRRGTQKSILERKAPPTFGVMVEIISRNEVAVHHDVAATVDAILRNVNVRSEHRRRADDGEVIVTSLDEARRNPATGKGGGSGQANGGRRGIVDITSRQSQARPSQRSGPGSSRMAVTAPPTDITATYGFEQAFSVPEVAPDAPPAIEPATVVAQGRGTDAKPLRLYPFGISRNRLESAIGQLGVPAMIVRDLRDSDIVVTLKNYYRRKPQPLREAENRGTPVYVLRSNTETQMENVLTGLFPSAAARRTPMPGGRDDGGSYRSGSDWNEQSGDDDTESDLGRARPEPAFGARTRRRVKNDDAVTRAIFEAEEAITEVMSGSTAISLAPQGAYVRRLQHQLADRYNLGSRSRGREPHRHVEIYRDGVQ